MFLNSQGQLPAALFTGKTPDSHYTEGLLRAIPTLFIHCCILNDMNSTVRDR
jgi:hypothetical protein